MASGRRAAPLHSLADLAALKRTLQQREREAAEEAARQRERAAREALERHLFAHSVGPVEPVRRGRIVDARAASRTLPSPVPRQRERDEAAVMHDALSDDFDAEALLETDESLSFRRPQIGPEVVRKLRRGAWAIQAQLDLHGMRRDEARERLRAFLRNAGDRGLRCVRVVHGKGHGSPGREPVLKAKTKGWLAQHALVIAFTQARPVDGGAGALLVLLDSRHDPRRSGDLATPGVGNAG